MMIYTNMLIIITYNSNVFVVFVYPPLNTER